jgi:DNA-binding response OmpR family regulator
MNTRERILIIDDNPKNIQVVASILNQNGYDSEFALNGVSGLNWLETESFDLVLLDVMMPDEDGFEVCKLIRSNSLFKEIPIIFVTAKADRESLVMGFEVGGDDYVVKPFDTRELLARVRNQIELRRNRHLLVEMNNNLSTLVEEKTGKLIEAYKDLEKTNSNLVNLNTDLKKLEESKQQFLDLIGHEVVGALNDVTGIFQVIKYKVDSKKVGQLIDRIDSSLSKVESFVTTSLRITQLQAKGAMLKMERLDVYKLIGFSLLKLDDKIRRKQIKFEIENPTEPILILGESQLLMTCFIVVLDFFIERNSINSAIKIELISQQTGLQMKISDNGPKIDDTQFESLFDLFSTNRQSLRFARIIAEAHFGVVRVKNLNNSGIELSLELYSNESIEIQ